MNEYPGTYQIGNSWFARYTDATGKMCHIPGSFTTQESAFKTREKARLRIAAAKEKEYGTDYNQDMIGPMFRKKYIPWLRDVKKTRPSSIKKIEGCFNVYINPIFGRQRIGGLTLRHAEEVIEQIKKSKNPGGPGPAFSVTSRLKSFYKWAEKKRYIKENEIQYLDAVKPERLPQERLSEDQFAYTLELASNNPMLQIAIATVGRVGCRPGELHNMRWTDFDWPRHHVHISDQRRDDNTEGPTKTKAGVRNVFLFDDIYSWLLEWKEMQTNANEMRKYYGSSYLFGSTDFVMPSFGIDKSKPFHRSTFRHKWWAPFRDMIVKEFGFENKFRFYDLRGTCLAFWDREPNRLLSEVEKGKMMGWTNIATMRQIYRIYDDSDKDSIMRRVESISQKPEVLLQFAKTPD